MCVCVCVCVCVSLAVLFFVCWSHVAGNSPFGVMLVVVCVEPRVSPLNNEEE